MSKQNKRPKSKSKERFESVMARKGMSVVLILAALILIVSIVSLSFSWFKPISKDGRGASYNAEVSVRSESCTIATYEGTSMDSSSNGKIDYAQTPSSGSVTIAADHWQYFKTVITNTASDPTNVSLYISQFPTKINGSNPPSSFTDIGLGVATPTNNYREYTSAQPASGQPGLPIIRNIYVSVVDSENEDSGATEIEWFVKNTSTDKTVTIDLSKLFIMYN